MRRNSLARAKRLPFIDNRLLGLGSVAREVASTLALDRFSTTEALDAQQAFGGVASPDPLKSVANGGIEASPHNLVHMTIGLSGDMGSPKTAARDPIFWLHHANIDRMWVRWTDAARGRFAPVDDPVWMTTKFTFVDENGEDQVMTGAEVLDTQFQLGYRYDDDAPRQSRLEPPVPVIAALPGGAPKGMIRGGPSGPVVLARADGTRLLARQIRIALNSAPQNRGRIAEPGRRVRLILNDVAAADATPPYDVFLASAPPAGGSRLVEAKLGTLAIFGGAGRGMHAHGGAAMGGAKIVFEATDAIAELARQGSFDPRHLAVSIVRRGFAQASGGDFVPLDSDPPRIGSIELLQS
jgi:tyrosinase